MITEWVQSGLRMILGVVPRSPKWGALRTQFLRGKSCAACGSSSNLEAHHLTPVHVEPALELDERNLIPFCRDCHFLVGHLKDWSSWNADAVQDAAVWLAKIKARP